MNIFDGHEDKTTEELADELGIQDLSVIEKAGKETMKTLESDDNSSLVEKKENSVELSKNNGMRTNDYILIDLKKGMKMKMKNGNIFQIRHIDHDIIDIEEILYRKNNTLSQISYGQFKEIFRISAIEKDWSDESKWLSLTKIKKIYNGIPDGLIKTGVYIRNKEALFFYKTIGKINKEELFNDGEGYKLEFPFSTEGFLTDDFVDNFSIHKSDFAQYQVKDFTEKDIALVTSLEDVPVGTRLVDINDILYHPKILTVNHIGTGFLAENDNDIKLVHGNAAEIVSAEKIINGNYFYLKDVETDKVLDTEDETLWAQNCNFDDLREGMRVNILSDNSIKKIWKITKSKKSFVLEPYHNANTVMKFSDIGDKFSICSEDLREVNTKNFQGVGIDRDKLKDDSLWEDAKDIDSRKLKVGMRVRKKDGGRNDGDGGKITEIDGETFCVNYVGERNGGMYLVVLGNDFEVLKEDLEEPIRTDIFQLERLIVGTKVSSLVGLSPYKGTISEITEESINCINNDNIGTSQIPIEEFLSSFKVDSRKLANKEFVLTKLERDEIENNSLWEEFNEENWDKVDEGTRIRIDGFGGIIKKNNGDGDISIEYVDSEGDSITDIGIDIKVFKEDIRKFEEDLENKKIANKAIALIAAHEEKKLKEQARKNFKAIKKKIDNGLLEN